MKKRFLQFGVLQFLLLVAALSLLVGIIAPSVRNAFRSQRLHDASADLRDAVQNNEVELSRRALEAGANANATIGPGSESLLRYCIDNGQIAVVELLLQHGADPERVERLKHSIAGFFGPPLYAAIGCNQPTELRQEMARLLIQYGADVRARTGDRNLMDVVVYQSDPEMAAFLQQQGLPYGPREMAAFNQLEQLQRIVAENPGVLQQRTNPIYAFDPGQEPTLLGMALSNGHRDVAKFLIDQGAPLDTVEGLGQTLMHMAVRGGNPELISLLAAHGLDANARDKYQDTPLTDRVSDASPAAISALIAAGADVNSCRWDGRTALHLAVSNGRIEVIQILLAAGADPSIPDKEGKSPFDLAREKDPKFANLLSPAMRTEPASHVWQ